MFENFVYRPASFARTLCTIHVRYSIDGVSKDRARLFELGKHGGYVRVKLRIVAHTRILLRARPTLRR